MKNPTDKWIYAAWAVVVFIIIPAAIVWALNAGCIMQAGSSVVKVEVQEGAVPVKIVGAEFKPMEVADEPGGER